MKPTKRPDDAARMEGARSNPRFALVDVFAAGRGGGNPLPVVLGADDLPPQTLQWIAREFNQSETTFVLPPTRHGADRRLRSFTAAGVEVFGAGGHNTLGAWWWLAQSGALQLSGEQTRFHQEIGDSVLPLTVVARRGAPLEVVMDQQRPCWGAQVPSCASLAAALGLAPSDIDRARLPVQTVSTGAAHLLVPLRDAAAVDRAAPDATALLDALQAAGAEGCYVYSLDARHAQANAYARFFNPTVGIAEDPATGTAAEPLAAHLVAHKILPAGVVTIEQGTAIGRTSLIRVEVEGEAVRVRGSGVTVATGALHLGAQ